MTAPQPPPSGDAAARAERVMQEHSAAEARTVRWTPRALSPSPPYPGREGRVPAGGPGRGGGGAPPPR